MRREGCDRQVTGNVTSERLTTEHMGHPVGYLNIYHPNTYGIPGTTKDY